MNIFKAMKPDAVYNDLSCIPFTELRNQGKKCILLDYDNTLGPDHAADPVAFAYEQIRVIREAGLTCCLVSNAKSGRSKLAADTLEIPCVTYARKPSPDGIYRALSLMNIDAGSAVMVGDQIFTDVIAGRFAGVYTILVEKYAPREIWYVQLKRPFEKLVRLIGRF